MVPQRRFAATMIGPSATSYFAGDKSNGCIRVTLRSSRHSLGSLSVPLKKSAESDKGFVSDVRAGIGRQL